MATQYYFDNWGWLRNEVIEGRGTEVAPPANELPVGKHWNFTGYEWIELTYIEPPTEAEMAAQAAAAQAAQANQSAEEVLKTLTPEQKEALLKLLNV